MSSSPSSSSSSELVPLAEAAAAHQAPHFAGFLDVRCRLSVVLGTGTISVRDCLGLTRSSVIRLEQSAGEDLQVAVSGIELARGEVVIIDDSTALRLTEISRAPGGEGRA
jgi:flagellar motor switch protein FliN/FliY